MATYTERLAQFARQLRFEDLPAQVVEDVKLRVLDTLGVCLVTTGMEYAAQAAEVARGLGGAGPCTVVKRGGGWSAPGAAWMNGALVHGIDFDDVHGRSIMHMSSVVVPAGLAAAEARGVRGAELLTALVAGYEVLIRMGLVAPGEFHARGWQATGVCGSYVAALVAGRLAGLDEAGLARAMGQCGVFGTGLRATADDGTWSKPLCPGWAALGGLVAVELAQRGYLAPAAVLEGRWGLYNAYVGLERCDLAQLTRGLGSEWETPQASYKPYPVSGSLQSVIDCALWLRKEHEIHAEEIEEIELVVGSESVRRYLTPREVKVRPPTTYAARFSLPYVVAVALMDGRLDVGSFTEEKIRDPRILALTQKVRHTIDPEMEVYPRRRPAWVRVRTRGGTMHEHRERIERGSPENPLTPDGVVAKFLANAEFAIPRQRAEAIHRAVMQLEQLRNVRELMSLVA